MSPARQTIRHRVALVVVLVTALGILLASVGVFILQRNAFQRLARSELNTVGDVVGGALDAALTTIPPSPADAGRTLERLRNNSEIDEVHVFLAPAELFASAPDGRAPPAEVLARVRAFSDRSPADAGSAAPAAEYFPSPSGLWLVRYLVDYRGNRIALAALHSTLGTLRADERRAVWLLGGVTLLMLGVAFWAAMMLNRNLTAPILALAGFVRRVEESGDRTLRAVRVSDDEVGQLADAINRMLGAIEERSAALRESEEWSRTLLAAAPAGIVVLDLETGKFVEANDNACRLFQLSREALLQRGPVELSRPIQTHGRDAQRYAMEMLERALAGEQPRFEWVHVDSQGRELPCEVFLVRLQATQRRLICGTILDMTERKRAEEVLLRSQASLEEAQALARVGSWEVECDTGVVRWSREQCRLFGQPPGSPPPSWTAFLDTVDPEDRDAVRHFRQRLESGDASTTIEFRIVPATGTRRVLSVKATVDRDADGRIVRFAGTSMDVTEQRRLESERRSLENQLRQAQKLDALGTLAGGIAHDFNNVLSAILGNVELARADLNDRESVRDCLEEINKAGRRARDLVQRILAFSRRQEQSLERMTLQPVVEEALKLLRSTLPASVALKFESNPVVPPVMGDPSQIHQMVMNLATNAWHALEDQPGTIQVSLSAVQVDSRLSKLNPDLHPGPYARLDIMDTGKGMTSATLERIFEPFFTTKPQGKGTGLGLSMVHGTIKSHAGAITVESKPNQGSRFSLYFPAVEAGPVVVADPEPPVAAAGAGEHVLFIDDEEPLVYLATRALERMGYTVTGHTHADKALNEFRADPLKFDLVVTDQSMPGASGLEIARELLQLRPETPVVLASGYLREEEVARALAIGIREVVLKPNTVDQLGPIIRKVLGAQHRRPLRGGAAATEPSA